MVVEVEVVKDRAAAGSNIPRPCLLHCVAYSVKTNTYPDLYVVRMFLTVAEECVLK